MIKFSFLLFKKKVFYTIYKKGAENFQEVSAPFIVTYVFLYKIEL